MDEGEVEVCAAYQHFRGGIHDLVANLETRTALSFEFAEDVQFVVGVGGLPVFEAGEDQDRRGVPLDEVREDQSAFEHVIVASAFAVLKVNRIVDVPEGIDIAASHPHF